MSTACRANTRTSVFGKAHEGFEFSGAFLELPIQITGEPNPAQRQGALSGQRPQKVFLVRGEAVRFLEVQHDHAQWTALLHHRQHRAGNSGSTARAGFEIRIGGDQFAALTEEQGSIRA